MKVDWKRIDGGLGYFFPKYLMKIYWISWKRSEGGLDYFYALKSILNSINSKRIEIGLDFSSIIWKRIESGLEYFPHYLMNIYGRNWKRIESGLKADWKRIVPWDKVRVCAGSPGADPGMDATLAEFRPSEWVNHRRQRHRRHRSQRCRRFLSGKLRRPWPLHRVTNSAPKIEISEKKKNDYHFFNSKYANEIFVCIHQFDLVLKPRSELIENSNLPSCGLHS